MTEQMGVSSAARWKAGKCRAGWVRGMTESTASGELR